MAFWKRISENLPIGWEPKKFPARSTYFDRYRRAHGLFEVAVRLQREMVIAEGVTDPQDVAVDKSMVAARGPLRHKSDRKESEFQVRGRHDSWNHHIPK